MPHSVCPWWIGYLLLSPVRRWTQSPRRILEPWVRPGMTVVDVGCAMGYFTLPLAGLVGPDGRVVAVDLQERMLRALERRARRAGLSELIETRRCGADTLGLADLAGCVDFALVFAVAHEIPDVGKLMVELAALLSRGGTCAPGRAIRSCVGRGVRRLDRGGAVCGAHRGGATDDRTLACDSPGVERPRSLTELYSPRWMATPQAKIAKPARACE